MGENDPRDIEDLFRKIRELEMRMPSTLKSNDSLSKEIASEQDARQKLDTRVGNLNNELRKLEDDTKNLRRTIEKQDSQKQTLEKDLAENERLRQDLQSTKDRYEKEKIALEQKNKELFGTMEKQDMAIKNLNREIEKDRIEHSKKIQQISESLEELKKERKRYYGSISELLAAHKRTADRSSEENRDIGHKLSVINHNVDSLEKNKANKDTVTILNEAILQRDKTYRSQIEELEKQIGNQIDTVKKEINHLDEKTDKTITEAVKFLDKKIDDKFAKLNTDLELTNKLVTRIRNGLESVEKYLNEINGTIDEGITSRFRLLISEMKTEVKSVEGALDVQYRELIDQNKLVISELRDKVADLHKNYQENVELVNKQMSQIKEDFEKNRTEAEGYNKNAEEKHEQRLKEILNEREQILQRTQQFFAESVERIRKVSEDSIKQSLSRYETLENQFNKIGQLYSSVQQELADSKNQRNTEAIELSEKVSELKLELSNALKTIKEDSEKNIRRIEKELAEIASSVARQIEGNALKLGEAKGSVALLTKKIEEAHIDRPGSGPSIDEAVKEKDNVQLIVLEETRKTQPLALTDSEARNELTVPGEQELPKPEPQIPESDPGSMKKIEEQLSSALNLDPLNKGPTKEEQDLKERTAQVVIQHNKTQSTQPLQTEKSSKPESRLNRIWKNIVDHW